MLKRSPLKRYTPLRAKRESMEALDADPSDFTGKAYAFLDEQEVVP